MVPRMMEPGCEGGPTGPHLESVLTYMPRGMLVRKVSVSIEAKSPNRYTGDP